MSYTHSDGPHADSRLLVPRSGESLKPALLMSEIRDPLRGAAVGTQNAVYQQGAAQVDGICGKMMGPVMSSVMPEGGMLSKRRSELTASLIWTA